jgi:hypothetical protein
MVCSPDKQLLELCFTSAPRLCGDELRSGLLLTRQLRIALLTFDATENYLLDSTKNMPRFKSVPIPPPAAANVQRY